MRHIIWVPICCLRNQHLCQREDVKRRSSRPCWAFLLLSVLHFWQTWAVFNRSKKAVRQLGNYCNCKCRHSRVFLDRSLMIGWRENSWNYPQYSLSCLSVYLCVCVCVCACLIFTQFDLAKGIADGFSWTLNLAFLYIRQLSCHLLFHFIICRFWHG